MFSSYISDISSVKSLLGKAKSYRALTIGWNHWLESNHWIRYSKTHTRVRICAHVTTKNKQATNNMISYMIHVLQLIPNPIQVLIHNVIVLQRPLLRLGLASHLE